MTDVFAKRNIDMLFFNSLDEVKNWLLDAVPLNASIGVGNSQTVLKTGVLEAFIERGNIVYDKRTCKNEDEIKSIKKNALLADCYVTGSNAVSTDGRIVNIDHSGNRVAAMAYGPEKVYIIAGKNKITRTLGEALERARNTASPQNARRAGYNPPCAQLGKCIDCTHPERICNVVSIIEGQQEKGRITLLIVDEDAGY